jgi:hypothetical protein
MVLVDEKPPKWEAAPPPYTVQNSTEPTTSLNAVAAPPPFSRPRPRVTFTSLPQHVLLEIVQASVAPDETTWTEHRLALWWLARELRLVSTQIYTGMYSLGLIVPPKNVMCTHQSAYSVYAYPPIDLSPRLRLTHQAFLFFRPVPALYAFTARPNLHSALPPTGNGSARSVYTPEDKRGYQVRRE